MQSRGPNASLIVPLYTLLENWYEALRLLIISWEENQEGVLMFLKMMRANTCSIISVRDAIESFFRIHDTGEFLRFAELKAKSYIPSTLNTDYLVLRHMQLIVCVVKY